MPLEVDPDLAAARYGHRRAARLVGVRHVEREARRESDSEFGLAVRPILKRETRRLELEIAAQHASHCASADQEAAAMMLEVKSSGARCFVGREKGSQPLDGRLPCASSAIRHTWISPGRQFDLGRLDLRRAVDPAINRAPNHRRGDPLPLRRSGLLAFRARVERQHREARSCVSDVVILIRTERTREPAA